jgi:hypothetical protein
MQEAFGKSSSHLDPNSMNPPRVRAGPFLRRAPLVLFGILAGCQSVLGPEQVVQPLEIVSRTPAS